MKEHLSELANFFTIIGASVATIMLFVNHAFHGTAEDTAFWGSLAVLNVVINISLDIKK